jgi:phosphatidylinositol-bisphosphatase
MVDSTDIMFDTVRFIEPAYRTLAIANTGQVPVQFEFIKKPGEERFCRPWLIMEPSSGFITQGQHLIYYIPYPTHLQYVRVLWTYR